MLSDEEIYLLYGRDAIISRRGRFTLVHLDRPSAELVRARTDEFDPDEFFDPDCRLCLLAREGGIVVFEDPDSYDEEEILME
jgi:hypothetical protein